MIYQEGSVLQEIGFKEAGEILHTPVSTLRRWVVLLEEQGYSFNRGGKRRQLDWQDVGMLRELKIALQELGMDEALKKVINKTAVPAEDQPLEPVLNVEILINAFDTRMSTLQADVFWQGQQAVSTLCAAWEELKTYQAQ